MDSFLVMISERLWDKLTNAQLDSALKLFHGRMMEQAPVLQQHAGGAVASWAFEFHEHRMTGFLELDAGPRGEHVVTLFDEDDDELMAKGTVQRLEGPGLRQVVFLRTVN